MNVSQIVPKAPDVLREAIIVMAGAFIAAIIVRGMPADLRRWFSWPAADQ